MMLKNIFAHFLLPALILALGGTVFLGCGEGRGFALPAGNAEAGAISFIKFNCNSCHSIGAIEFEGTDENQLVALGGTVARAKTYGELVTSVINPSHEVAKSYRNSPENKMKSYNELITVQELVDLVTFLQSEYEVETPDSFYYPY